MKPTTIVETKGSFWHIDENERTYLRLPKTEGGRERPDWGDASAGPLQDGAWLPYDSWFIREDLRLCIITGETGVSAPGAEVVGP